MLRHIVTRYFVFIAVSLAACAPAPSPTPSATARPTTPQNTPATRTTVTPLLASKDIIKIATASPLSGEQTPLGEGLKFSAQLAVKQLSQPLSDMGFKVKVVPFDDQGRGDIATQIAKTIVADPDVLVVIGHMNSDAALSASDIYKSADLPMITPSATNPKLTTRGYANVDRIGSRDDMQGQAAAHFAVDQLIVKKIYVIHDKTTFGQGTAQSFSDEARRTGASISGLVGTEEQSNFDSLLDGMKSVNLDSVFFTGGQAQGSVLLRRMRDMRIMVPFIATERIDNAEFPRLAGEASEGIFFETALASPSVFPDAAQFMKDYRSEFNKDVPVFAAQAYDATAIALRALTTLAKNGKPTRKGLAQAVRATKDYRGITGTFSFNSNGDPTLAKYFFVKVTSADPRRWEDNPIFKIVELAPPQ
jgi:branched-chain amino acid transport system substrate-binding protein